VSSLHISELAAESGVPVSTLRYYERIGLVEPEARSENGYRLYGETAVDRLAFIGRAKRLGMSLDDITTLIEAWFAGECEPLQEQLRGFVSGRIAQLRRQIADESAFERQLDRILTRLNTTDALPARCAPDCGCDLDPGEMHGGATPVCSLREHELHRRISDWRKLLALATRRERVGPGLRFVFANSAPVATALARMCAAETECCPFFEFALDITVHAIILTVDGPDDAAEVFAGLAH
jgi:DNA-binding transcriptional MerR regulator